MNRPDPDAPQLKLWLVAQHIIGAESNPDIEPERLKSMIDECLSDPHNVMRVAREMMGKNSTNITLSEATYIRSIVQNWRLAVANGTYQPALPGPLALTNDDFRREVAEPLMFYHKPRAVD